MAISNIKMDIIARDKTKRAFRSVKNGVKGVTKSIFSLKTGIVSVAGITGLGLLVKRSLDASDELAKMSRTVGVSVEALQRLRHAASLGGLEATKLDKAIQKFAVNIADANKGTGEAKDVFEKYRIATENADGSLRSVGDVLGDTAEVFKDVTNKTEKAEIAYRLFGARGGKMVNVLQQGKKALHETMLEADKLGLVMSEKTLKGVEDANDSMTRFGAYLRGTFHKVVAELAPVIERVTNSLREWLEGKFEASGGMGKAVQDMASAVVMGMVEFLGALESMAAGLNTFIFSLQESIYAIREWIPGLENMSKPVKMANLNLNDLQHALLKINLNIITAGKEASNAGDAFGDMGDKGEKAGDKLASAFQKMKQNWNDAVAGMKSKTSDAFMDMMFEAKKLSDVMQSLARDIARAFVKKQIADPLATALGDAFSFGGGKAAGGPVTAGRTYLVGEKGPELFTPANSGGITPNNQLGGQPVNINFTVNAMDSRSFAQGMAENRNIIIGTIRQAFNRNGKAVAI